MYRESLLAFAALCVAGCQSDVNVTDYILCKLNDINQWDKFFPMRVLEEERLTNLAAVAAVGKIGRGLYDSLNRILEFQMQELQTAQVMMNGTNAEGCIHGIAAFLSNAINNAMSGYEDCTADANSTLVRLNKTWVNVKAAYLAAYQKSLKGIESCARTYPNKDSIDRLMSCVDSMCSNYFTAASIAQNSAFPSPSMSYFQDTIVDCASKAANNVAAEGKLFLGMLLSCSALDPTIDQGAYAKELNGWKGYNDTLDSQIADAQVKNYNQVWGMEKDMIKYYNMQQNAKDFYIIKLRNFNDFLQNIFNFLSNYYNTVIAASVDNPADSNCAITARKTLDSVSYLAAANSLMCYQNMSNNTNLLIHTIFNGLLYLDTLMGGIGNVAILNCFSQGYIFAPGTIKECFSLVYWKFNIDYEDNKLLVAESLNTLSGYVISFNSNPAFPCGGTSSLRALLGGEVALNKLQRCIYIDSGTIYSVTTPFPYTTTYAPYTTYSTSPNPITTSNPSTAPTSYTTDSITTTAPFTHTTSPVYSTWPPTSTAQTTSTWPPTSTAATTSWPPTSTAATTSTWSPTSTAATTSTWPPTSTAATTSTWPPTTIAATTSTSTLTPTSINTTTSTWSPSKATAKSTTKTKRPASTTVPYTRSTTTTIHKPS